MKGFISDLVLLKFMPCHRKPERSWHPKGSQFPVCFRCMFILIGYLAVIPLVFIAEDLSSVIMFLFGILLNVPMVLDGFTQLKKWRISNNFLRSLTGLLSGIGMSIIMIFLGVNLIDIIFKLL